MTDESSPYDHILLMGFGGPTRPEEVRPFIAHVVRGVSIPESRLQEVAEHYARVGGSSPYCASAEQLNHAITRQLTSHGVTLPIVLAMRHGHPFINDVLQAIATRGLSRGLAVILAPHRSPASVEKYVQAIDDARHALGGRGPTYEYLPPWYAHPLFIQAQAAQVREAMAQRTRNERDATHLVFTAHSIPMRMAQSCAYADEVHMSSELVAKALGDLSWSLAYQSRSGSPREAWLGPGVETVLKGVVSSGASAVLVVPIGFVCDNVEILYDLDVEAQQAAHGLGLRYLRAATVASHPQYVAMLSALIRAACETSAAIAATLGGAIRGTA